MKQYRRGSALLTSILLVAIIATAAFGMARLAFLELDNGRITMANAKAYYLAEGGLEEALLRYRYDPQTTTTNGTTLISHQANKLWQRTTLDPSSKSFREGESVVEDINNTESNVATTIYNRVSKVAPTDLNRDQIAIKLGEFNPDAFLADFLEERPDLHIQKDNKIIMAFPGDGSTISDLDLIWRWDKLGRENADTDWSPSGYQYTYGVEIRLYQKDPTGGENLLKKRIYSLKDYEISNANTTKCSGRSCEVLGLLTNLGQTALPLNKETYLSITPLGASIYFTAFPRKNSAPAEIIDSVSHLESIGMIDGRMRALSLSIDRTSGRVLNLYDYVIYQGKNN